MKKIHVKLEVLDPGRGDSYSLDFVVSVKDERRRSQWIAEDFKWAVEQNADTTRPGIRMEQHRPR